MPRKKKETPTAAAAVLSPDRNGHDDTVDLGAVDASLFFNERDFQNYGKFVPFLINYGHSLTDADIRLNKYQRSNLVDQSRNYVANIPEIPAALQRLADFTVGSALQPLFNGVDQEWSKTLTKNYLNKVLSNLTRLGLAADWTSTWQLVLKTILTDGDMLMIPYTDRYGLPHLDFIEGHRIGNRDGDNKVKGGRFEGYDCEDGVIYADNGNILGYQITVGDNADDDYTIAKANCYLLYSPFSFKKGRGIPILASAARHGRNLMDYQHYVPQIVKQEGSVQLIETNLEGKAPPGRTAFSAYNAAANPVPGQAAANALTEYTQAGIRYIRAASGKLESLKSNRPTQEVQAYITATQKELLCALFPHQFLLSPETIGGPGARGVKEILVAAINTHRAMIEKWALVGLQYVLAVGMNNPTLQQTFNFTTNFKEDWTDWSFSKAPEPSLDPGYERSADLAELAAGIKSPRELAERDGKSYDEVLRQISEANYKRAAEIVQFQKTFPTLAEYAPQMYGLLKDPKIIQFPDTRA